MADLLQILNNVNEERKTNLRNALAPQLQLLQENLQQEKQKQLNNKTYFDEISAYDRIMGNTEPKVFDPKASYETDLMIKKNDFMKYNEKQKAFEKVREAEASLGLPKGTTDDPFARLGELNKLAKDKEIENKIKEIESEYGVKSDASLPLIERYGQVSALVRRQEENNKIQALTGKSLTKDQDPEIEEFKYNEAQKRKAKQEAKDNAQILKDNELAKKINSGYKKMANEYDEQSINNAANKLGITGIKDETDLNNLNNYLYAEKVKNDVITTLNTNPSTEAIIPLLENNKPITKDDILKQMGTKFAKKYNDGNKEALTTFKSIWTEIQDYNDNVRYLNVKQKAKPAQQTEKLQDILELDVKFMGSLK